jgi:hypothetical protein
MISWWHKCKNTKKQTNKTATPKIELLNKLNYFNFLILLKAVNAIKWLGVIV